MNQNSYNEEVLKHFTMGKWTLFGTLFDANLNLFKLLYDKFEYSIQTWVGSIMYAMVAMRTDIAFVVNTMNTMNRIMSRVGSPHRLDVKHIMRYLKGNLDFELYLKGKDVALK